MFKRFRTYPTIVKILFSVYIFSFSGATVRHISDLLRGGWLPYVDAPLWMNAYWTSLTFLDPLAVLLIFISPLWALVVAVLIMVSDVGINSYWAFQLNDIPFSQNIFLQAQTGFAIFVLLTAPFIWNRLHHQTFNIPNE